MAKSEEWREREEAFRLRREEEKRILREIRARGWMGDMSGKEELGRGRVEVLYDADTEENKMDIYVETEYHGTSGSGKRQNVRGELGEWEFIERSEIEGFEEFKRVWGEDFMQTGGGDWMMGSPTPMILQENGEEGQEVDQEGGRERRERVQQRVSWFNGIDGEVSAVREFGLSDQPRLTGLTGDDSWASVNRIF